MKNILGLLLLSVVVVGFLLFWDSSPEQFLRKPATVEDESSNADSFIRNSRSRSFDPNGALEYRLTATETRFFKSSGHYELDHPSLDSIRRSDEIVHLTADRGTVYRAGERIVLDGNVYAWKQANSGRYEIRTPRMTFFPEKKYAEGAQKVRLASPQGNTRAVGFRAYFEEDRFELLAEVKSHHVP